MRPLSHFSSTSSVSISLSTITPRQVPLGTSEKKQASYKFLMGLIVLMFVLQTIDNICDWYIAWLGFIFYGDASDQGLDALQVDGGTSLSLLVVGSMLDLLVALRLAIADSIMVSTSVSLPANAINSLRFEGLEVLDRMQPQSESSDRTCIFQSRIYRYVTALGDK
jgi:hypothetical protein